MHFLREIVIQAECNEIIFLWSRGSPAETCSVVVVHTAHCGVIARRVESIECLDRRAYADAAWVASRIAVWTARRGNGQVVLPQCSGSIDKLQDALLQRACWHNPRD